MRDLASMFKDVCLTDRQRRKKQARINRGFDPVWAAPDKWEDLIKNESVRALLLKKALSSISVDKPSSEYEHLEDHRVVDAPRTLDDYYLLMNRWRIEGQRVVDAPWTLGDYYLLMNRWHHPGRSLLTLGALGSVESSADRRQRIQQRWDARLLRRLSQNTAPAKAAPKRPGRL
ncbi:hypothetical protein ERT44_16560 [Stenotrophomonas sp. MA5]|uniref:hypothetical protein n=1 Tax=Stenotrophomonas sp. MA5 TaxID=2508572 RepID=UPI001009AF90|nr:hypothetical protein [Stenotrophomonas sp. MA5]RXK64291.1 hypothetical protein ERT44_16560 [Stenotrophomonas sp. MA5]